MGATKTFPLLAAFALSSCAHTPTVAGWICLSELDEDGVHLSSLRTLGRSGRPRSFEHGWSWQADQAGVRVGIGQEISNRRTDAAGEIVRISVGLSREMQRLTGTIELRAGPTGSTTVWAERRTRGRTVHIFQSSLANVRELARAGRPLEAVLLDGQGQALQSIPLDIGIVERARADWQTVIARTLEMTRDYRNRCFPEFDTPIVIA